MIVVTGSRADRAALVEQAYREHSEEASREGVLFVPEEVLGEDEETRAATLLAIHRDVTRGARIRDQARADSPLARARREAWRRAGL